MLSGSPGSSPGRLPFTDMSATQDQEYFGDGIAEEILNALARLPELKVIAHTSSFRVQGPFGDTARIRQCPQMAF